MNKKAFTLVELIVVVTILAVLGTIAYVSLQGYSESSRDTKRVSELKNIELGVEIFFTKSGIVPVPDNKVNLTASGEIVMFQGFSGDRVLEAIGVSKRARDPITNSYYTYVVSENLQNYQVLGFLEGGLSTNVNLLNKSIAFDYASMQPVVYGDKLGVLLEESTNRPIQELGNDIDISSTSSGFTALLDNSISGKIAGDSSVISVINPKYSCDRIKQLSKRDIENGEYKTFLNGFSETSDCNFDIKTSCNEIKKSGENNSGNYNILFQGIEMEVYCDMETYGGGWTLIDNKLLNEIITERSLGANNDISLSKGTILPVFDWSESPQLMVKSSNYSGSEPFVVFNIENQFGQNYVTSNNDSGGPSSSGNFTIEELNGNINRGTRSWIYNTSNRFGTIWIGSGSNPTAACAYYNPTNHTGLGSRNSSASCSTWVR